MIGRDDSAIQADMQKHIEILRDMSAGEAMVHLRGLLVCIDEGYKRALADVSASDLPRMQGALHQNQVLHEAIFGMSGTVPRL